MLAHSAYGKSRIRLVQVRRGGSRHDLRDLTIAVRFRGHFDESYTDGDNSAVLPTDTMKNTVYALAARDGIGEMESFGLLLARHFMDRNPSLVRVRIDLTEHGWSRIPGPDQERDDAFVRQQADARTAVVHAGRQRTFVLGGLSDLVIMKTGHSAFEGFLRDEFTTLRETRDRLLATSLTATWRYGRPDVEFAALWQGVRATLLDTFAVHHSESVQHTLHAMGRAVLDRFADITTIRLVMPNRHHLPVDLTPFGLENRNEIFVATEEPFGVIEAMLVR